MLLISCKRSRGWQNMIFNPKKSNEKIASKIDWRCNEFCNYSFSKRWLMRLVTFFACDRSDSSDQYHSNIQSPFILQLSSLSIVERAKLLGRIAPRRNLERFQTHVCRCCESRRRVRVPRATHESRFYVCTKTNRFDGGLLNLPGVQTIFLISISIDKEWCIFVPIVRQSVTTCSRNDTDVRGNDIPIKVESVERVGRFKSIKSLAVNFDLNALYNSNSLETNVSVFNWIVVYFTIKENLEQKEKEERWI